MRSGIFLVAAMCLAGVSWAADPECPIRIPAAPRAQSGTSDIGPDTTGQPLPEPDRGSEIGHCLPPVTAASRPAPRVGHFLIAGNNVTRDDIILAQIPLAPGQVIDPAAIAQGQANLAKLGIFEIGPTVTVVDDPSDPDGEFKDVLVTVKEKHTGTLMLGLGCRSDVGPCVTLRVTEANFDAGRWPAGLEDEGMFRGAGQKLEACLVMPLPRPMASFAGTITDLIVAGYSSSVTIGTHAESPAVTMPPVTTTAPLGSESRPIAIPPNYTETVGSATVVSDVVIYGNRLVSADSIRGMMRTRIGKEYSADAVQEDIRTLYRTGQFAKVYADKKDDGPGKVKVLVYVMDQSGAIKRISYQGNRSIDNDDLDSVIGLRVGSPLNPTANKLACGRIVRRYGEEGRPFSSCDLVKGGEPGDTEVVFNITEGPIVHVTSVSFTGNTFVSGGVLRNRIDMGGKGPGQTFCQPLTEDAAEELVKYYKSFGFHKVQVSRELRYSDDRREVEVTFHIIEGERFRIAANPQIIGATSVPAEPLAKFLKVKAGDVYSQIDVDTDTANITAAIGYTGQEVKVVANPVFPKETPGLMRVNYEVVEQKPVHGGQIIIVGHERTRDDVILRPLPVYPGETLPYPEPKQGERDPDVSPEAPPANPTQLLPMSQAEEESEFRDIVVSVEASGGSLMWGVCANSDSGASGSIVFNERNFDVLGLRLSFSELLANNALRGPKPEYGFQVRARLERGDMTPAEFAEVTFQATDFSATAYPLTVPPPPARNDVDWDHLLQAGFQF